MWMVFLYILKYVKYWTCHKITTFIINITNTKRLLLLTLYLTSLLMCEILTCGINCREIDSQPFFQCDPSVTDDHGCECMWTLVQSFDLSAFKQLLDLLHSFPKIRRPSALPQSDSCRKAKAGNAEPEGWCVLICGPSDLYRGVKPSVF